MLDVHIFNKSKVLFGLVWSDLAEMYNYIYIPMMTKTGKIL